MRTTFFNILLQDHTTKHTIPKPQPMTAKPHINPRKSIGNYWLGKTLGHGSSGCVKLGFHKTTMEKVAIKIISKAYLQTSEILANATKREMAILKLVRHPNVVRYIEAVDDPNVPYVYIIMEYVEGCELFDYLIKCRRINEPEARDIFWQVCVAVDWCHQRNICHRDLKPENILLSASKQKVKLVDFGMASMQLPTSLLRTSCGSPHYACPEIVTGKSYDGRLADVWSCGVILFALLSGRLPFEDNSVRNLLHRIKSGQYVMSTYFSDDARDLISRMLTTDPKKRIKVSGAFML
ncbi:hypothetical protein INT44_000642 [Umbelopsis vinacea]|uniref:Protein kinase domain-containing protein n=1 Tax=Umbelopsis vinacea TaxID=44442 RepID=A0A8H7Q8C6_9FUNG|nr:hypothetical protein INT44_000642 [Umbelopsis vinacea]